MGVVGPIPLSRESMGTKQFPVYQGKVLESERNFTFSKIEEIWKMPGLFFNMIALPQWKQIVFDNSLWIVIEKCLVGHMSLYSTYKTLENTLKEIRTRLSEL